MHDEIERCPSRAAISPKTASMVAGSVTSQWPTTIPPTSSASGSTRFLQRIALIGEGELGALRPAGLGDAPGDRAVVGDPHDQAALAAHETGRVHHVPRSAPDGAASYGYGIGS